jgi:hypothetical protein
MHHPCRIVLLFTLTAITYASAKKAPDAQPLRPGQRNGKPVEPVCPSAITKPYCNLRYN